MGIERDKSRIGARGMWPNQSPEGIVPDTFLDARGVIVEGPGRAVSWNGMASRAGHGTPVLERVNQKTGGLTTGNIFPYRIVVFFIGSGAVYIDTITIGAASGGLAFYDSLDNIVHGAGLAPPPTPVIAARFNMGSNLVTGTRAVIVTFIRTSTGAESNGSNRSIVVCIEEDFRIELTLPTAGDAIAAGGANRVGVYVNRRGAGEDGPFYFLKEYAPNGSVVPIEFTDSQLSDDFAPIDYNVPPQGTHACALGPVVTVFGTFQSTILGQPMKFGVSPSIPLKPEAYPVRFTSFLNPAEDIIGVIGRSSDNFAYVLCKNSLHVAILTASPISPLICRCAWSDVGFASQNAACLVFDALYGFNGLGPCRTQGQAEPDTSFALSVASKMKHWVASEVVVGFSPDTDHVVYCWQNECYAYHRKLDSWSGLLVMPGTASSAVTLGGELLIAFGASLYAFNKGTASGPWFLLDTFRDPLPGMQKTIREWYVSSNGPGMTAELLINLDRGTIKSTASLNGVGDHHEAWIHENIRNVVTWATRYSGNLPGQSPYDSTIDYSYSRTHPSTASGNIVCSFILAPISALFDQTGGSGSVNVIASDQSCSWTAVSQDSWIHVISGASGAGNGSVGYTVDPGGPRVGTILIAGLTFTVTETPISS